MYEQVGAAAVAVAVIATPVAGSAVQWAPQAGRPQLRPARLHAQGALLRARGLAVPARLLAAVASLSAVTLGLLGARVGPDPALVAYIVFGLVAVVLALVDLQHHRLPDVLTLPSYAIGALLLGLAAAMGSDSGSYSRALAGAAIGFGVYALLYLAVRSGIGAGDVKYSGVVGMHAAWLGWGSLTVALIGGFVVGGLVSIPLALRGRAGLKTRLPFGPAMVAGAVIGIVWGEPIAAAWLV